MSGLFSPFEYRHKSENGRMLFIFQHTELMIDFFTNKLKPHLESVEHGVKCVRLDQIYDDHGVLKEISEQLQRAEIVIVDITGRNPDALYGLGASHSLIQKTIIISQNIDDVPIDLRDVGIILYNQRPEGLEALKDSLKTSIEALNKHILRSSFYIPKKINYEQFFDIVKSLTEASPREKDYGNLNLRNSLLEVEDNRRRHVFFMHSDFCDSLKKEISQVENNLITEDTIIMPCWRPDSDGHTTKGLEQILLFDDSADDFISINHQATVEALCLKATQRLINISDNTGWQVSKEGIELEDYPDKCYYIFNELTDSFSFPTKYISQTINHKGMEGDLLAYNMPLRVEIEKVN